MWLLAGFTSVWTIESRASGPHWLLAGGHPHFHATWAYAQGSSQHGSFLPQRMALRRARARMRARGRERANIEVTVFCSLSSEATSHYFCHSVFIRCQQASGALQGRKLNDGNFLYKWCEAYQEVKVMAGYLSGLPTTNTVPLYLRKALAVWRVNHRYQK